MRGFFTLLAALFSLLLLALCAWPAVFGALITPATVWGLEGSLTQVGQLYTALEAQSLTAAAAAALGLLCLGFGVVAARGVGRSLAWAWAAALLAGAQWALALSGANFPLSGVGLGLPLFGAGLLTAGLGIAAGGPRSRPLCPAEVPAHTAAAAELQPLPTPFVALPAHAQHSEIDHGSAALQSGNVSDIAYASDTALMGGWQGGESEYGEYIETVPLTVTPLPVTPLQATGQEVSHTEQLWWDDDWAQTEAEENDWPQAVGYRSTSGD